MVSAEKFVEVWQRAKNIREVVAECGVSSPNAAYMRGIRYRKLGIPLKFFGNQGRKSLDVKGLAALARKLA